MHEGTERFGRDLGRVLSRQKTQGPGGIIKYGVPGTPELLLVIPQMHLRPRLQMLGPIAEAPQMRGEFRRPVQREDL